MQPAENRERVRLGANSIWTRQSPITTRQIAFGVPDELPRFPHGFLQSDHRDLYPHDHACSALICISRTIRVMRVCVCIFSEQRSGGFSTPNISYQITADRIRNAKWAFQPLTLSICSQLTEICVFPAHAMISPDHATINTTTCTSPTICIMRSSVQIYSPRKHRMLFRIPPIEAHRKVWTSIPPSVHMHAVESPGLTFPLLHMHLAAARTTHAMQGSRMTNSPRSPQLSHPHCISDRRLAAATSGLLVHERLAKRYWSHTAARVGTSGSDALGDF